MSDEMPETPDLEDPRLHRDRGYRDGYTGKPHAAGFPPADRRTEAYGDGYRLGELARQGTEAQQRVTGNYYPVDGPPEPGEAPSGDDPPGGFRLAGVMTFGSLGEFRAWAAGVQAVDEAETAMRGEHPVSVVHGDPESDDDAKLIYELLPRCARMAVAGAPGARIAGTRGGNDYTTWRFAGDGAERAAGLFAGYAAEMARVTGRTWWNVTATAQPQFPGWGPLTG